MIAIADVLLRVSVRATCSRVRNVESAERGRSEAVIAHRNERRLMPPLDEVFKRQFCINYDATTYFAVAAELDLLRWKETKWRWTQSRANRSLRLFPDNSEKYREFSRFWSSRPNGKALYRFAFRISTAL